MNYKTSLVMIALAVVVPLVAQERKVFQGCSGGMMLHVGYLFGENGAAPYAPQGVTYGVGGAARVHLFDHLRIGGEGYVSTMPSSFTDRRDVLRKGSYVRNGWGGLLADAYWRLDKAWPYVGAMVGGGAVHSLYLMDGSQDDWQPETASLLNKQSYFCVAPFVGCDYLLTPRVHLTFKLDWVIAIHDKQLVAPTGPRFYFGFMFCH
ncbi:MAG: hypothetical protein ACI30H_08490 [Paludibacteraceae bacterium]